MGNNSFAKIIAEEGPSVSINASYIEALLCKKLIRCKIYFLHTFFINGPFFNKYVFLTSQMSSPKLVLPQSSLIKMK
jgi:hypothetical protein